MKKIIKISGLKKPPQGKNKKAPVKFRFEPLTYYVLRKALALTALVSFLVLLQLFRLGGINAPQKIIPLFRDMLEHLVAAALLCPSLALLLDLALKKSK